MQPLDIDTTTPPAAAWPWVPDLRGARTVARRLSDLLTAGRFVHLADPGSLRAAVDADEDPILYRADRDVLAPRPHPGQPGTAAAAGAAGCWFADLVTYRPGLLPRSDELVRSIGHWNAPAQLEVFQCLRGRVLMLTAPPTDPERSLRAQLCGPGDLAVIPPGGWHLTAVVDGPATVFNIYTDLPARPASADDRAHSSRAAAHDDALKYHSRPPVQVSVIRVPEGIALTGSDLIPDHPVRMVTAPARVLEVVPPAGLAALHAHGTGRRHTELLRAVTDDGTPPAEQLPAAVVIEESADR